MVRIEHERGRVGMTHGSRDLEIFEGASANADPERTKAEYRENQANSKAACFRSYSPQCRHECVDGKNLVRCCINCCSWAHGHKEKRTNEDDQGNPKFAKLLGYALRSAIWSRCDDTVVNPPDIENATHGLRTVEKEKGSLTRKPI
jgi:hypothetical protein